GAQPRARSAAVLIFHNDLRGHPWRRCSRSPWRGRGAPDGLPPRSHRVPFHFATGTEDHPAAGDPRTSRHPISEALGYRGTAAADRTRTLFGQTMGYVAATTGFFALGAYLGRHLSQGWAIVWFIVAFGCLIAMNFTVRRSTAVTVVLLMAVGAALGLAMAPTLVYYASTSPQALWQAGGATALFIAGFGAAGYATRRDLSGLARLCFWALVALIVFGI